jgi:hypothetical protein
MAHAKMVYVSEEAHHHLKLIAARRKRPMGKIVEEWVEQEMSDLSNPWTTPEGLSVQQQALAPLWEDKALDVYNDA